MSNSRGNVKSKGKDSPPKSEIVATGGCRTSDRPGKKRDGSPDKSSTPTQEQDESSTTAKNVIWNEDIEKLHIKTDDLPKLWPPRPPLAEKNFVTVQVQKMKKLPEKKKRLTVAKPAPPDAPLKPLDFSGYVGPRYTKSGEVIPYSILGTYEDYYREANQRGQLLPGMPQPTEDMRKMEFVSVKQESEIQHTRSRQTETKALRNWHCRMMERKKQQAHISKLLNKAPEDLVMNQSDTYHEVQEQRYLIDRTIPKVDYGKGYRVGSEFWQQQEQFGDDLTGLHMTLTQTQRGYPPPVEHVGLCQIVKEEKGCEWVGKPNIHANQPWQKSEFFNHRKKQLQPFIDEIDPWRPEFDGLQVIGSNKPSNKTLDVETSELEDGSREIKDNTSQSENLSRSQTDTHEKIPESQCTMSDKRHLVFGPSLLFGGQPAGWTGDSFSHRDKVGIETTVSFEAFTEDRITSYLELVNDGTTAIYYDWKKIAKENPFELVKQTVQRFYFNSASGVILPGETLKFPFVFKSPNAGVFAEQWKMETRPVVCGGAALLLTLRGVALERDKFKSQREALEKELHQKQARLIVTELLYKLVNGIRTPERSCSPIDAYITEEEIFLRNNPGLMYSHELVSELKDIHKQIFHDNVHDENIWSLSIEDLQESIQGLDDENDKKEMLLHQMNSVICKLTYVTQEPVEHDLNPIGRRILVETIDRIVRQSWLLRQIMGLPDRDKSGSAREGVNITSQINIVGNNDDNSSAKSGENKKGQRVPEVKDKIDAGKDKSKGNARNTKTPSGKLDPKGKATPTLGSRKTPASTPVPTIEDGAELGRALSSNTDNNENAIIKEKELEVSEKLYKEKFTLQVYNILGDMASIMDNIFSAIRDDYS